MIILGVHSGHDSSAAIIKDGTILVDVQEERFVRIKHYSGLPYLAIDQCLKIAGIEMADIDAIAFSSSRPIPDLNLLFEFPDGKQQLTPLTTKLIQWARRQKRTPIKGIPIYFKRFKVHPRTQILNLDHHLCHAASAYYTSGTPERQLIITADGVGDGYSICLWEGDSGNIRPLKKWRSDASLGWFYSNVTEALGWWHGDGEGKTMGLAPYGDYERIRGILTPWHPIFKNGELITPHDYGQPYFFNETGAIQYHFDESSKIRPIIDQHGPEHVAAEAQRVLEEQMFQIILPWAEKTKNHRLSCAGGIFLNVKLNQRIWETSRFPHQHIFPNAGDSGLAVGAALLAYYQQHPKADFHPLEHLYFGNQWSHADIVAALQLRKVPWRQVPDPARFAAEQLANDKIVAWFQGRMESGPRALGNRSILMSANKKQNKDIINAQVKFREAFRPFCPSILWEKKEDYLEHPRDEFFMITSFTCKANKRDKVPAVVHADHTLRPQTVKKDSNPRYWELINHFGQITGEYLVLNTSFNLMGEAIISTPRDAIKCFFDNGIDILIMDDIVLEKARLHSC